MTFTNLENKVLKTTMSIPLPPTPPTSKVDGRYFRAEKVTRLRLLFAIEFAYPADRVTKRSVYRSP